MTSKKREAWLLATPHLYRERPTNSAGLRNAMQTVFGRRPALPQIGNSTLTIGCSRLGLRAFGKLGTLARRSCGGCIGTTRGVGLVGRCRLGAFLIGLGRGLVGFAAVIGLVKTGALEQHGRADAEDSSQLSLAALRALLQRGLGDRLKLVEIVLAGVALIFIRRHSSPFFWDLATDRVRRPISLCIS